MRLRVVIPVVVIAAAAVGTMLYAVTGGFSNEKGVHARAFQSTSTTTAPLPITTLTTFAPAHSSTTTSLESHPNTTTTTTTIAPTNTTVSTLPPSQVSVEVFNGSGQPGQAGTVASALRSVGFTINGMANALTYDYTASKITYAPDSLAAAETVASHITGAYALAVDSSLPAGVVDIIVGSDYAGVRS